MFIILLACEGHELKANTLLILNFYTLLDKDGHC